MVLTIVDWGVINPLMKVINALYLIDTNPYRHFNRDSSITKREHDCVPPM